MSRTTRRTQSWLINRHVGAFEKFAEYSYLRPNHNGCTIEQQYQHAVHRFTRDRHSGIHGAPRWFRKLHYTRPERRMNKHLLKQALITDQLDTHSVYRAGRGATWFWKWQM